MYVTPRFIHNKSISSCCVDVVAGCENKIPMITHMSFTNGMLGGGGGGGHLMAKCGELHVHVGIIVHRPADFSFACCELQKSPLSLTDGLYQVTLTLYHHSAVSI